MKVSTAVMILSHIFLSEMGVVDDATIAVSNIVQLFLTTSTDVHQSVFVAFFFGPRFKNITFHFW